MTTPPTHRSAPATRQDDRGTAMVEFAMVSVLFLSLVFGIVNMGVLLSFKQNLTQAASESARAAVAVIDRTDVASDPTNLVDERYTAVDETFDAVVGEFDRSCGSGGVTCARVIHDCAALTSGYSAASGGTGSGIAEDRGAAEACMTVRIEFDNTGDNRIMPSLPLVSSLEPSTMGSQTTVRLVPVSP